jgi:hypothetical protein
VSQTGSLWDEGIEPGRQVVALGVAVALTVVTIDVALGGELSLFFDLSFVTLCLGLALAVRPGEFFTAGVLPPLIMVAVFALLALVDVDAVARPGDGVVQAVVSGLAHHSAAPVGGYLVCLATLWARQRGRRETLLD